MRRRGGQDGVPPTPAPQSATQWKEQRTRARKHERGTERLRRLWVAGLPHPSGPSRGGCATVASLRVLLGVLMKRGRPSRTT